MVKMMIDIYSLKGRLASPLELLTVLNRSRSRSYFTTSCINRGNMMKQSIVSIASSMYSLEKDRTYCATLCIFYKGRTPRTT